MGLRDEPDRSAGQGQQRNDAIDLSNSTTLDLDLLYAAKDLHAVMLGGKRRAGWRSPMLPRECQRGAGADIGGGYPALEWAAVSSGDMFEGMTMPTIIAPATEDEMIATFLSGELGSSRFGVLLEQALAQHGLTRDIIASPDPTNEVENRQRRDLLTTYRGWGQEESVFGGLPADQVAWMWVELGEGELRERVFYIRYFWEEFSGGTRRPLQIARRVRHGDPDVGSDLYLAILEDARRGRMPPEPILLADPGMERLVILEGHMRITAYMVDSAAVAFPIRAMVGVSADIAEWSEW